MSSRTGRKLPSITKLEAARRQIDFAIERHFSADDPFAIHTVISAALGILRALAEMRGNAYTHRTLKDLIRPGKEREAWGVFTYASNFLKHADKDPDSKLENIGEEINDLMIFLAAAYYADLAGAPSPAMSAFQCWYAILYPRLVLEVQRAKLLKDVPAGQVEALLKEPREIHLKIGHDLLRRSRAQAFKP